MSDPHPHYETPIEKVLAKKYVFAAVFFAVFFVSLAILQVGNIVPYELTAHSTETPVYEVEGDGNEVAVAEGELPLLIEIPSVGVKANVANPNSTDISALDRALLGGAVRYPGSGELGEEGNVLLFGHSSYLPVVHNQAYKAFNDIQKLEKGAEIRVSGENKMYLYAVETVEEANTATGEIPLRVDGARLTLATCDTFGAKSDRFIVTAVLVDIQDL